MGFTVLQSGSSGIRRRVAKFSCVHLCSSVVALALIGCAAGPAYRKPEVETPAAYKGEGTWKQAEPKDTAPKGRWWEAFNDRKLGDLVEQVSVSNQQLRAAEARYAQARAAVQASRAALFPVIGGGLGASRSRRGGEASGSYGATLDARWEADLWGRIRRAIEAVEAGAQASAADLEALKLLLQSQLATAYFQLRVADVQQELLDDTVKGFERSYGLTQNRYRAGVAARADVVQAEAQLLSTRAQAIDVRASRAQLENAIAVLAGRPPSAFSIERMPFRVRIPDIPPGLPSTLLERRPDIAAAERRMASTNARIGAAQAAWFPSLDLTGSGGFASGSLAHLVSAPNRIWSLGAALAGTILDFGARGAQVRTAEAAYDEAVANYRQTVLDAFLEVEDNLALLRWLAEENRVQQEAARAARESVVLVVNQYKAGTVSYLNVVQAQATQLAEERQTVNLLGRRIAATIALIRALGGLWWWTLTPAPWNGDPGRKRVSTSATCASGGRSACAPPRA